MLKTLALTIVGVVAAVGFRHWCHRRHHTRSFEDAVVQFFAKYPTMLRRSFTDFGKKNFTRHIGPSILVCNEAVANMDPLREDVVCVCIGPRPLLGGFAEIMTRWQVHLVDPCLKPLDLTGLRTLGRLTFHPYKLDYFALPPDHVPLVVICLAADDPEGLWWSRLRSHQDVVLVALDDRSIWLSAPTPGLGAHLSMFPESGLESRNIKIRVRTQQSGCAAPPSAKTLCN